MTRPGTPVTRLLGIALPILQWAEPDLAAALSFSEAGGLGVLEPDTAALSGLRASALPVAVQLPQDGFDALCADPLPVVIAPPDGGGRARRAGRICIQPVRTLEAARRHAASGVDALLAAGPDRDSTLALAGAIAAALPGLPLIASGGFTVCEDLVAALAAGAGAVQLDPAGARDAARLIQAIAAEWRRTFPPPPARPGRVAREQREAAALRDNLRRRKAPPP